MSEFLASRRIGVLGGTFDPIHLAHIELAKQAIEQCRLSKLIVVPCSQPPHRDTAQASNTQRWAMLELAFLDLKDVGLEVEICDYELNKPSVSYTVETLEFLSNSMSDAQLVFCLGEDSLRDFTHWHRWQDILSIAHLAVMQRQVLNSQKKDGSKEKGESLTSEGFFDEMRVNSVEEINKEAGQVFAITAPCMPISATLIREHIKACPINPNKQFQQDKLLSTWLMPKVLEYIIDNKVYQ